MFRTMMILPFVALVACGGGKDDGTGTDGGTDADSITTDTNGGNGDANGNNGTNNNGNPGDDDDDDTTGCSNEVESMYPADGQADAFYRTDVVVTLDDPDAAAMISVDGVTGVSGVEDNIVYFEPDAPLTPGSTYTASVTYECGTESWSFTVSDVGAPTASSPNGQVFSLDLSSGVFVKPGGPDVGALIGDLIGDTEVLFGVTAEPTDVIPMIGAVGDGTGSQDICYETLDFPVDPSYEDPYFSLEAPALSISAAGLQVNLDNFELSGAFTPDVASIQGGTLKGSIDTRTLKEALSLGTDAPDDAVCGFVAAVGVQCEECPNGDGPYCLGLWVTDLEAANVGGTITPITAAEAEANCP
jgi:hypothetical protein